MVSPAVHCGPLHPVDAATFPFGALSTALSLWISCGVTPQGLQCERVIELTLKLMFPPN